MHRNCAREERAASDASPPITHRYMVSGPVHVTQYSCADAAPESTAIASTAIAGGRCRCMNGPPGSGFFRALSTHHSDDAAPCRTRQDRADNSQRAYTACNRSTPPLLGHLQWSCGREAEGGGLLNRYTLVKAYRGFESLRLRQTPVSFACQAGPADPISVFGSPAAADKLPRAATARAPWSGMRESAAVFTLTGAALTGYQQGGL